MLGVLYIFSLIRGSFYNSIKRSSLNLTPDTKFPYAVNTRYQQPDLTNIFVSYVKVDISTLLRKSFTSVLWTLSGI